MIQQTNKITLDSVLVWKGKLLMLPNGDKAVTVNVSAKFGTRNCRYYCTAYNNVAERLVDVDAGESIRIDGAIYQDIAPGPDGKNQYWTKIRINSFQEGGAPEPNAGIQK